MTAAFLDKQPELLDKWSKLNPMGRIGRPDELRGVVTWLAGDASSFCTGSEYVCSSIFVFELSEVLLQHLGRWWAPCMVKNEVPKRTTGHETLPGLFRL